ncbi:hypothetical protein [Telluribacter humicola]|uniref:hypothetical protein n=1 Tax=Telluribacter humicola TaxID=1720261 RepID=UPI001A96727C|nr:hypothetical protein [Telluribacter humicola]
MQNVPPAEKKLLLWQMIGICVLVLLALVQMRRVIPGSSPVTEPSASNSSVAYEHENRRYNATQAILESLGEPGSYEEINYREFFSNSSDPKRYYQATIRFKAKDASGAYVVQRLCFHFTSEGDVTEIFTCGFH